MRGIEERHLGVVSSGKSTYWPTDRKRLPDLVDFAVTRGIAPGYVKCVSYPELSSDHLPILITLSIVLIRKTANCKL